MATEPTPHSTTGGPGGVSAVAIVALVLGVLAIILGCPFTFFALPVPIVGLILGFYALGKPNSRGVAIGAIVTSIVGIVTIIVLGLTIGAMWWAAAEHDDQGPAGRWGDSDRGVDEEIFERQEDQPVDYGVDQPPQQPETQPDLD